MIEPSIQRISKADTLVNRINDRFTGWTDAALEIRSDPAGLASAPDVVLSRPILDSQSARRNLYVESFSSAEEDSHISLIDSLLIMKVIHDSPGYVQGIIDVFRAVVDVYQEGARNHLVTVRRV